MNHRIVLRRANSRQASFLGYGALIFALLYVVHLAGPKLEEDFFPPAGEFTLIEPSYTDQAISFRLRFWRYRTYCTYSHATWFGVDREGAASLVSANLDRAPTSFDRGLNISGRWSVRLWPEAESFYGLLTYNCWGMPWFSRVKVGPFANWAPSSTGIISR